MRFSNPLLLATALLMTSKVTSFAPGTTFVHFISPKSKKTGSTRLYAIGVLARKAKEADVRKYCEQGVEDSVMEKLKVIKDTSDSVELGLGEPGPLQQVLTRRKGTITLIAEYKRKIEGAGYIDEVFDPEILSPTFREFGASGIAVMADERMGGCSYKDLADFIEEQRRAANKVPGSVMVINNDLIVDEIQVARTAAIGAKGIVLTFNIIGEEKVSELLKAAKAVEIEAIVAVSTKEEAQTAVNLSARIIMVVCPCVMKRCLNIDRKSFRRTGASAVLIHQLSKGAIVYYSKYRFSLLSYRLLRPIQIVIDRGTTFLLRAQFPLLLASAGAQCRTSFALSCSVRNFRRIFLAPFTSLSTVNWHSGFGQVKTLLPPSFL